MIYNVRHVTTVRYAAMVRLARFNLRLKPAPWPGQTLAGHELIIEPRPRNIREDSGPYIVCRSRLMLAEPTDVLRVESRFSVAVDAVPLPDPAKGLTVAEMRRQAPGFHSLSPACPAAYLHASPAAPMSAEISAWARDFIADDATVIAAGQALMAAIHGQFRYDSDATRTETPPIEAFRQRRGVCQDFAHIMIVAARAHAIPAAYVSGYLRTIPPPGKPRLVGADAMHAWVVLWCGAALGWIGFDPTNNMFALGDHIFTAMGRDYSDVSPLDGVFHGGAGQTMKVAVDVAPQG